MQTFILSALMLVTLVFNAKAEELADKHRVLCESKEAKALMANSEACRIVLSPRRLIDFETKCSGTNELGAECRFEMSAKVGFVTLKAECDSDEEDEDEESEDNKKIILKGYSYKASAVVTDRAGNDHIFTDGKMYSLIPNSFFGMWLSQDTKQVSPMSLEFTGMSITNISCE